jgi:hypothetical protein
VKSADETMQPLLFGNDVIIDEYQEISVGRLERSISSAAYASCRLSYDRKFEISD